MRTMTMVVPVAVIAACVNALIVFVVLVAMLEAPPVAVLIGCVWAVCGVYLMVRGIERDRAPKAR